MCLSKKEITKLLVGKHFGTNKTSDTDEQQSNTEPLEFMEESNIQVVTQQFHFKKLDSSVLSEHRPHSR
uniref:Uncharacterized protein n=1 Tax=Wuchereria bancrofti TaxID=6293 RepID=A0A1I8EJ55_WUCBA